jgi:hypothetical protein
MVSNSEGQPCMYLESVDAAVLELGVRMHPEDALLIQENVEVTFFNT